MLRALPLAAACAAFAAGAHAQSIVIGDAPPVTGGQVGRPALPEPSIVIGLGFLDQTVPPEATFGGISIPLDTPEDRERLRRDDPELFLSLLETGNMDPLTADLATAIQTDLARMGCYRAGVDGIFGSGSRQAVRAYFTEIGLADPPAAAATVEVYRAILLGGDVTCPEPVIITPPPDNGGGGGGGGQEPRDPPVRAEPEPEPPRNDFFNMTIIGRGG